MVHLTGFFLKAEMKLVFLFVAVIVVVGVGAQQSNPDWFGTWRAAGKCSPEFCCCPIGDAEALEVGGAFALVSPLEPLGCPQPVLFIETPSVPGFRFVVSFGKGFESYGTRIP